MRFYIQPAPIKFDSVFSITDNWSCLKTTRLRRDEHWHEATIQSDTDTTVLFCTWKTLKAKHTHTHTHTHTYIHTHNTAIRPSLCSPCSMCVCVSTRHLKKGPMGRLHLHIPLSVTVTVCVTLEISFTEVPPTRLNELVCPSLVLLIGCNDSESLAHLSRSRPISCQFSRPGSNQSGRS